jgi:hypothetical protein
MHEGKYRYSEPVTVEIQILKFAFETVAELNEKLRKHGERSEHFMEALSHYAQHSCT